MSYETICSSCGETIYLSQDDIEGGRVICSACGENNLIFSMDCPTCGEHFIYNGSEVFCGTVDCHSCGSECQPDFDDLRQLLLPLDLDEDEECGDDEVHFVDEDVKDEDIVGLRNGLLPNDLMQSFADEFVELAMKGYAHEDRSMDLFTILLIVKLKSTLPKDQCYQYLLKSLYDYYEKIKMKRLKFAIAML